MANVLGEAGGFQKERAIQRRLGLILAVFVAYAAVALFLGFLAGKGSLLWIAAAIALILAGLPLVRWLSDRQLRLAGYDEAGALGELHVLRFLRPLPDDYTVVCDLAFADSYGNIDHLVIGPTGIFAIDAKNWRGLVVADGKGELLYNGRPADKPHVRRFVRRVMDLKDRVTALTKLDPYIQAVFVFPRARVEAKWGTTGSVHCIRAEQLEEYITKGKGGRPLSKSDAAHIVSAVEALRNAV